MIDHTSYSFSCFVAVCFPLKHSPFLDHAIFCKFEKRRDGTLTPGRGPRQGAKRWQGMPPCFPHNWSKTSTLCRIVLVGEVLVVRYLSVSRNELPARAAMSVPITKSFSRAFSKKTSWSPAFSFCTLKHGIPLTLRFQGTHYRSFQYGGIPVHKGDHVASKPQAGAKGMLRS